MKLISSIVIIISLLLISCQPQSNSTTSKAEAATNSDTTTIESTPEIFRDLAEDQAKGLFTEAIDVQVAYDPVFTTPKRYKAIPFIPYLEKVLSEEQLDTAGLELVFICKDGYNPSMPISKVLAHQPYLAIQDLDAPEGELWMDTLQGLWWPYYLVWPDHDKGDKGYTWPYGLSFIRLINAEAEFKDLFPYDNAEMVAKFQIYKEKCLKCHAVNRIGGVMGPEFNIPKNITEYWTREDIMAFARNPQSYRVNARMAALPNITDEDLNAVVDYLEYMKEHKVE